MPTRIPPNSSLFVFRWSVAGDAEEMVVTLGGVHDPADTPEEAADRAYTAAVEGSLFTAVSSMNQPWTFVGVDCYKRLGGDPLFGSHTEPITATAGSATALPTNCSLLIKKITSVSGRKGRGRMYPPPALIDEGSVDTNGTITPVAYGLIAGRVNAFYAQLVAQNIQPMLFHADGAAPTPVTSFNLDTRIATQRQRMRR